MKLIPRHFGDPDRLPKVSKYLSIISVNIPICIFSSSSICLSIFLPFLPSVSQSICSFIQWFPPFILSSFLSFLFTTFLHSPITPSFPLSFTSSHHHSFSYPSIPLLLLPSFPPLHLPSFLPSLLYVLPPPFSLICFYPYSCLPFSIFFVILSFYFPHFSLCPSYLAMLLFICSSK